MILFLTSTLWAADVDIAPEDASEIASAISLLRPGDTLRFTGGSYDVWNWSFTLQGDICIRDIKQNCSSSCSCIQDVL